MAQLSSITPRKKTIVLIVEDESLIRMNATAIIEADGYEVIEAANADQAIEILSQRMDVDIVFTDINMPGSMDGLRLAMAVRNLWPPIRLIVTSGKNALADSDLPTGGRFLSKPYSSLNLTNLLATLS